jgi:hypothetical protein
MGEWARYSIEKDGGDSACILSLCFSLLPLPLTFLFPSLLACRDTMQVIARHIKLEVGEVCAVL